MYCGTCGAALVAGARFCGQCGSPLPATPPTPGAAGRSPVPSRLPARPYVLAQPALAPAQRISPFLAGLLECFVPGVGLLYADSILAGSLVLVFTLLVGGLLFLYGLGIAPNVRPIALLGYFTCVGFVLLAWLVARIVWAVRAAHRRNAVPQMALPYPPATATRGQPYMPPSKRQA